MQLLVSIVGLVVAMAAQTQPVAAGSPTSNFVALGKSEIQAKVIGHRLTSDGKIRPSTFSFIEKFETNGIWRSWREGRGVVHLEGTWTIENDGLCVKLISLSGQAPATGALRCRKVWLDPKTGDIVMADLGLDSTDGALVEFSVKPIKQLK